jgi:hypothetical protein
MGRKQGAIRSRIKEGKMRARILCVVVLLGVSVSAGIFGQEVKAVYVGACPEAGKQAEGMAPNVMLVSAIGMSARPLGGAYVVRGVVRIVSVGEEAVPGATVSAEWTLPSGSVRQQAAASDTAGRAIFRIRSLQTGRYQICITDVARDGWQYDPWLNRETFESLIVP